MLVRSQNKINPTRLQLVCTSSVAGKSTASQLFSVRNPDIFHLGGMLEKPAPFS